MRSRASPTGIEGSHGDGSTPPLELFISYSRRDFYFAEQLAVAIRRRGLRAWFDAHELLPGSDWSEEVDRAIARCDLFVLVTTRSALASD
ncbi:MAG: toll/interleukin-1 receptor domain-containing protein, partial [Actinobacteria bacterium]|nr:toll/interleukin-1 receptor domain-containing protein [Actinomycetota bacterium]